MNNTDCYISPFSTRYASKEMQYLFSDDFKFRNWRKLWIALAKAEKELGIEISDEQIAELEANAENINYDEALKREKETRHDVMSHVFAYGVQCPKAKGIIHLGATSCFVGDNTDIIIQYDALSLIKKKLVSILNMLYKFSMKYKALPTLAYTHMQPAQPTTVGKRASLWINDLVTDFNEVENRLNGLELRGCKGTTGTQASYLELFNGDEEKVQQLEGLVNKYLNINIKKTVPVSGQTYSRKSDYYVLSTLSGIAQSTYKFASDLRMLQSFKELEEPFGTQQIGSSAMPYKRNPMRSERICSLARFVMVNSLNASMTASTQWFERTLDDSANRRLSIAEGFLAIDSILNIMLNICDNIIVYEKVISNRLQQELPFMATENIMMHAVKAGGDRQVLHEKIRTYAQETAYKIKMEGKPNDLINQLVQDKEFYLNEEMVNDILDAKRFAGLAEKQTEDYLLKIVKPILDKHKEFLNLTAELNV